MKKTLFLHYFLALILLLLPSYSENVQFLNNASPLASQGLPPYKVARFITQMGVGVNRAFIKYIFSPNIVGTWEQDSVLFKPEISFLPNGAVGFSFGITGNYTLDGTTNPYRNYLVQCNL